MDSYRSWWHHRNGVFGWSTRLTPQPSTWRALFDSSRTPETNPDMDSQDKRCVGSDGSVKVRHTLDGMAPQAERPSELKCFAANSPDVASFLGQAPDTWHGTVPVAIKTGLGQCSLSPLSLRTWVVFLFNAIRYYSILRWFAMGALAPSG